jgi:hypothetical protein
LEGGGKRVCLGTFTDFGNLGGITSETMVGILRLYAQVVRPHADITIAWYFKNLGEAMVLLQNGFIEFLHETNEVIDTAGLPTK